MRGDILGSPPTGRRVQGSPPRARGHPIHPSAARRVRGLTPACAGTSVAGDGSRWSWWAHPRVRGDINWTSAEYVPAGGSPPRARGHRRSAGELGQRPGLTPACAGTSRTRLWGWSGRGAHPRVRGDVPPGRLHRPIHWGSPPRARGRRVALLATSPARGLTPACAGTSTVHALEGSEYAGSPPRARGRRCVVTIDEWPSRAHPRVRGDVPFGR